jgi:formamidopyrimidine-DNA glycosylase
MPELPEMETYRRLLTPLIVSKPIHAVTVNRPKSINVEPEVFERVLRHNHIVNIERRAKHLLFELASGQVLVLHLMLGGSMFFSSERDKPDRTTQIEFHFGEQSLYFIGLRLGYLHLFAKAEADKLLAKLGPEPLSLSFADKTFLQIMKGRKGNLKVTLVDQSILSGIGNCYSDEICFHAGLLPTRRVNSLSEDELKWLYASMRAVLTEAIHYGGYMTALYPGDQLTGQFDSRCRVYDRENEPCVRCGSPLVKVEVSSRKCFYCVQCQH